MRSPRNVKEVQKLTGKVVALNRFISRASDRCEKFFRSPKVAENFQWTKESEVAFQELKRKLKKLPTPEKVEEGGQLYLYYAALEKAVTAVLLKECDYGI